MKKQILALSCALVLGAGAAWSPATAESVQPNGNAEPTAQVAYVLVRNQSSSNVGKAAMGAGAMIGGASTAPSARAAATRVATRAMARGMIVRGALLGARIGAFGGFAGFVVGAAVGAA